MGTGIQYVHHKEIDEVSWDQCISNSPNGLIYAYSFYLDTMSKQWDALVLDDYKAVMPLTWNSKFGIRYLYQPFLTAQLGLFGKEISTDLCESFIQAIPDSFRLIEISLNSRNSITTAKGLTTKRNNYVLNLNRSYEDLCSYYNENTKRNCKKAVQSGCTVQRDIDVEKIIELALGQMNSRDRESTENTDRFRKLCQYLSEKKMAATYGISQDGRLLASCVFFFSHNRAYYILVGNHPDSRLTGASHALIDAFIKDHAGRNMVLDFEGSDIPGLASFYSSFGAINEPYPFLRINRLPFYLKWMKR